MPYSLSRISFAAFLVTFYGFEINISVGYNESILFSPTTHLVLAFWPPYNV